MVNGEQVMSSPNWFESDGESDNPSDVIVQPLSPDLSGAVCSVFGAVATRTPDLTDSILRLQENRPQLIGLDPEVFA